MDDGTTAELWGLMGWAAVFFFMGGGLLLWRDHCDELAYREHASNRRGELDMLGMATKLNVGCGPHYAAGWCNTDMVFVDGIITPDVMVEADDPFPFDQHTFDRAYLGHVLEHVPWADVPVFLAKLQWVLKPGAPVMFVGPDSWRAIDAYRAGTANADQVRAVIEGQGAYYVELQSFDPGWRWDGDRHHWNCYEARVVDVLTMCGFTDVTPFGVNEHGELPEATTAGGEWPVVSRAPLQFAVSARTPG